MPKELKKKLILVSGTYTLSDAYPNVRYRIEALKQHPLLQVKEAHSNASTRLRYTSQKNPQKNRLITLISVFFTQIRKSAHCLLSVIKHRHVDALYIPYPAIPLLFLLSFIPPSLRPKRIVADVFISLYDTIVTDRKLLDPSSVFARLLHRIEQRSLLTAHVAITDTPENTHYLCNILKLPKGLLQDLPLSINEEFFKAPTPPSNADVLNNGPFKVLFVGTFVPLHRIDRILDAISQLTPQRAFEFTFIGDGQQAHLLESFLARKDYDTHSIRIRWIREWQHSCDVQRYIEESQLCLGIMGYEGKSSRVWPFKNYLYMASGKALISAKTPTSERLQALVDYPAFITVDMSHPTQLAEKIVACAEDPTFPGQLTNAAPRFFQHVLSQQATNQRLYFLITGSADEN